MLRASPIGKLEALGLGNIMHKRVALSVFRAKYLSLTLIVALFSTSPAFSVSIDEDLLFQKYQDLDEVQHQPQLDALSYEQIIEIYQKTATHPVTSIQSLSHYDPNGFIGFCFGRALTVHLLARSYGLSAPKIQKLFAIGDLKSSTDLQGNWRFHVVTVLPSSNGDWYALDPIFYVKNRGIPQTLSQWIQDIRSGWDSWHGEPPKARFYLTPAETIIPDIRILFTPEDGTKIIHLNFNPNDHQIKELLLPEQGLPFPKDRKDTIYILEQNQLNHYFITTNETIDERFKFFGIFINNKEISYNNYFVDLLLSDLKQAPAILDTSKRHVLQETLGSFDLTKFLGETYENIIK
jgi:hypothetical protein